VTPVRGAEAAAHASGEPPRFVIDENAARLVRWLRLLGYDALYLPGVGDAALVELAREQGRILLTRDRGIMARRPVARGEARALLLDSDDTWRQLEQVASLLREAPRPAPFTRCAACNGLLEPRPVEAARPHVPPFIAATHRSFMQCAQCARYYWRGSHWQRVTARLAGLNLGAAHRPPAEPFRGEPSA